LHLIGVCLGEAIMPESHQAAHPTPYPDVNAAVQHLLTRIRAILAESFVGMYLYGSLAQGDFNHDSSDIDIIVITARDVTADQFAALGAMHAAFRTGDSYWAEKIEAAYIQQAALNLPAADSPRYPQLEKDRELAWEPLELGWPFQRSVLRNQGVVVAGPDPATLLAPIPAQELLDADLAIVRMWQHDRHSNPTWLPWVRQRPAQRFFLVTLCRSLYRLGHGTLASKAAAAQWAQAMLEPRWASLIARSLANHEDLTDEELAESLAFLNFTAERLTTAATMEGAQFVASFRESLGYGLFDVCIEEVTSDIGIDWTDREFFQGFAGRHDLVGFATPERDGSIQLNVWIAQAAVLRPDTVRAVRVPFTLLPEERIVIRIGWGQEFPPSYSIPAGTYALTFAIGYDPNVRTELDREADWHGYWGDLIFVPEAAAEPAILVADDLLAPEYPLLMGEGS
jgi:Aminoglycoside adenylyltransferase, C-terminal domain/Competence protein J (ComJ)/Nucleotidyltransferase domain